MRIICAKCQAVYEIDKALIPSQGKKVRCSNCGDIFICYPQEDKQEEPIIDYKTESHVAEDYINKNESIEDTSVNIEQNTQAPTEGENETNTDSQETPEPDNIAKDKSEEESDNEMKDMFQRLSAQTEELFQQEQQMSKIKILWLKIKHTLGLQNKGLRRFILIFTLFIICLSSYYFRYDITRNFPVMEHIYGLFNSKSVMPGEGLEFQNITRREFEDDYVNKIEVKGYIANKTDGKIKIPTIRLDTLDRNARVLHEQYQKAPVEILEAKGKIAFSIIVTKPSPLSKYIYLTFVDDVKK